MKKISNLYFNSGVVVQGELMGKLDVRTDIQNECICLTFERDKHGNEAIVELSQNDFFALRKVVDSFEASVFDDDYN